MSVWAAGATIVGAGIGAAGNIKAGKAGAKGQKDASEALARAVAEAKAEIIPRFDEAQSQIRRAGQQSLNLLGTTPQRVIAPFQEGNRLAQEQIGRGLEQTQNAIMGNPLDLSGFTARDVRVPNSIDTSKFAERNSAQNIEQRRLEAQNLRKAERREARTGLSGANVGFVPPPNLNNFRGAN